jgi:hypothetical protein
MAGVRSFASRGSAVARRTARSAVLRAGALRPYDERRTIVVAGTARSGTTWVGQMFAALPRTAVVFEPLIGPAARAHGVGWHTVEGTRVEAPNEVDFVRRALGARDRNRWTMRDNSTWQTVAARTWIFKEVRVNRILPWMVDRFGLSRAVVVVRDPIAVVASQITMADGDPVEAWLGGPRSSAPPSLVSSYPWLADVEVDPANPVAQLALHWALDQLVPLTRPDPRIHVFDYDALRTDPRGHIAPLLTAWGFAVPSDLEVVATRPSSVTKASAGRPRVRLDDGQLDTIDEVCRAVGITVSRGAGGTTVGVQSRHSGAGDPR